MIGTGELASLQAESLRAMPDTVTILRSTNTRTAGGYAAGAPVTVGTSPCRLTTSPLTVPNEQVMAGQLASVTHWLLTVPADTDIRPGDQVRVQAALFEVLGGYKQASWNITDTYSLAEIRR